MRIGMYEDTATRWTRLSLWQSHINGLSAPMKRLSTGLRINAAVDDAAGLAIVEGMRAQLNGSYQAQRNIQDGVSLLNTADGALGESMNILQTMRTIAVQAANGVFNPVQRRALQSAVNHSLRELDTISRRAEHNHLNLLEDTAEDLTLQVGANVGDIFRLKSHRADAAGLGLSDTPVPAPPVTPPTPETAPGPAKPSDLPTTTPTNPPPATNPTDPSTTTPPTKPGVPTDPETTPTDPPSTTTPAPTTTPTTPSQPTISSVTATIDWGGNGATPNIQSYSGTPKAGKYNAVFGFVRDENDGMKVVGTVDTDRKTVRFYDGSVIVFDRQVYKKGSSLNATSFELHVTWTQPEGTMRSAVDDSDDLPVPGEDVRSGGVELDDGADARLRQSDDVVDVAGGTPVSVLTEEDALKALERIDKAIETLNGIRSEIGAATNALIHHEALEMNRSENLEAARARIEDADIPSEAMRWLRMRAISEASTQLFGNAAKAQRDAMTTLLGSLSATPSH